ncbi:transposase [Methanosarcina sp. 2.H.T.1A.6]|uniref:transposase n=1 Tax=Methanosarcina sp. 2.H.T.1A.6 TaxID=1483599 RepID=UPI0009E44332
MLITGSNVFSCTEAARCYPNVANAPSHDSFTRCLQRQPPDTEALWEEVKNHFKPKKGFLIVDDSTLDKPYAKEMAFVHRMWSGKHHRTVKGIGLVTLSWTNGTTVIPVDFRIYNIDEDDKQRITISSICLTKPKKVVLIQNSFCLIHGMQV